MKQVTIILLLLTSIRAIAQEPLYDRVFFANSPMEKSYYYSEVSYSGNSWIKNMSKRLPVNDSVYFTPGNSLEINYVSSPNGQWQAKLFYRPVRGQDSFSKPTHLFVRLFVSSETDTTQLPAIAIGNKKDTNHHFITLHQHIRDYKRGKWLTAKVPLSIFQIKDINDVDILLFRQQSNDGKEHILLVDQIEFLAEEHATVRSKSILTSAKGYERHIDITWQPIEDTAVKYIKIYRSSDGKNFHPVGIQSTGIARYTDYTNTVQKKYYYKISLLDKNYNESSPSNVASASTRTMSDDELLDMVQEAHFRYYWEGAEKNSGLALENVHGRRNMIATGASGFGIMALITGAERKFITRESLTTRFEKIMSFLEKADKFHGAFPHFLNGTTGKVEPFFGPRDNGADLVETSFLAQGMLAAKQYFNKANEREKNIVDRIDRIWKGIEWDWFRKDDSSKFLYWHWSPDQQWVINHKLIGWNETLITYFLAISSPEHGIPASFYYSGWASQSKEAEKYRSGWGQTKDGSLYTNGNTYYGVPLKVGVSNGGPLFFVHYSFLGLDPRELTDAYCNYFSNNGNIALINYRYCIENPKKRKGYGPGAWGLTASDGLLSYQADEPVAHQDHGKITPTGALASFPYMPGESMTALKNYYRNYGKFAWGPYGFYDAFNVDENWRSEIFMGLNQGPIVVMIENYRSGLLWRLFMSNPEVQQAIRKIGSEQP